MSDKLDMTPQLTLSPDLNTAAAAAPEAPTLTLEPAAETQPAQMSQAGAGRQRCQTGREPPDGGRPENGG